MTRTRIIPPLLVLLAALLGFTVVALQPASAGSTSIVSSADTYANRAAPTTNYGGSCCLASGGGAPYVSYLRFVVPPSVTGATLSLSFGSQTFAGSTSTFTIALASDTWTESTLTWNNRPAVSGTVVGSFAGGSMNQKVTVPLSNVSAIAGRQVTLAITGGNDDLWFWSREHGAASAPTLTVTSAPSPSPSLSSTVSASPTPSASATPTDPPSPSDSPTPSPTISNALVGVLGDSIAQGCCSTSGTTFVRVAHPFWDVTVQALGWPAAAVDAVGGSGYLAAGQGRPYTDRIGPFLAANPNLQALIIEGGGNDPAGDPTALTNAVNTTFDAIKSQVPTAHVYILGPYSPNGSGYSVQTGVISDAARAHGFTYVDQVAEQWMKGRSDLLWSDNFHPNEGGHDLLGRRLAGDLAVLACKGCMP